MLLIINHTKKVGKIYKPRLLIERVQYLEYRPGIKPWKLPWILANNFCTELAQRQQNALKGDFRTAATYFAHATRVSGNKGVAY